MSNSKMFLFKEFLESMKKDLTLCIPASPAGSEPVGVSVESRFVRRFHRILHEALPRSVANRRHLEHPCGSILFENRDFPQALVVPIEDVGR